MTKELFLGITPPGTDFSFGSNCYGSHNEDGSVFFNSHEEEQFSFDSIENFAAYYLDDDESIPHMYQYPIGRRSDEGEIEFYDGYSDKDEIDPDEDGSKVWSLPVKRGNWPEDTTDEERERAKGNDI